MNRFLIFFFLTLSGCEQLDLDGKALAAKREAEGKAVGSACRHAGRALEDCYLMNPKASKAAVFAGWREFDAYMRENNIEVVVPTPPPPPEEEEEEKPTKKKNVH